MGDRSLFRLVLAIALICGFAVAPARGSASAVSVEYAGADRIGTFLAHELTAQISGDDSLAVGGADDDGWKLVLLTSENGRSAFYSVVLVRKRFGDVFDQYVIAFNGVCSVNRLRSCAREIVEQVREPIDQFESNWRELSLSQDGAGQDEVTESSR